MVSVLMLCAFMGCPAVCGKDARSDYRCKRHARHSVMRVLDTRIQAPIAVIGHLCLDARIKSAHDAAVGWGHIAESLAPWT